MRILMICAERGPADWIFTRIAHSNGHSIVRVSDFREGARVDLGSFDVALVWYALLQKLDGALLRDYTPISRRLPVVAVLSKEVWSQQRPRMTTLADGWLFADDPRAEPAAVIRLAGLGYWVVPDFVLGGLSSQPAFTEPGSELGEVQLTVLRHLASGSTNRQIALATGLSEGRVKKTVHEILARLGLTNRTQAAILAASSTQLAAALPSGATGPCEAASDVREP